VRPDAAPNRICLLTRKANDMKSRTQVVLTLYRCARRLCAGALRAVRSLFAA